MGLFTQRPEEPSEWAGLPSEPARPRSVAEELAADPVDDDAVGLVTGDAFESISIPLPAAVPDATDASPGQRHEDSSRAHL